MDEQLVHPDLVSLCRLNRFSHEFTRTCDQDVIDKFNSFLVQVLDNEIDNLVCMMGDPELKQKYNRIFHPVKKVKPPPPPKKRDYKSMYVKESSVDKLPGDVIGDDFRYRNTGKLFWTGTEAVPLPTTFAPDGHVPPILCVGKDVQSALYWENTISYTNLVYVCFETVSDIVAVGKKMYTFIDGDVKWLVKGCIEEKELVDMLTTPNYWNNFNQDEVDCERFGVKPEHVLIYFRPK